MHVYYTISYTGTPCYLAPEVEYTSKGLGGTYGLPADCWSLGAVLYVMLVARFPEFEQVPETGKIVLRLPPALWDNVSTNAKELIRSLMNSNPAARLTVAGALQHPWLGEYRVSTSELQHVALSCYTLGQGLQEEEDRLAREEMEQEQMMNIQQQQQQDTNTYTYTTYRNQQQGILYLYYTVHILYFIFCILLIFMLLLLYTTHIY